MRIRMYKYTNVFTVHCSSMVSRQSSWTPKYFMLHIHSKNVGKPRECPCSSRGPTSPNIHLETQPNFFLFPPHNIMFLPRTLRASSSSVASISRALAPTCSPTLISRRYKSGPYGYTQAKALVYSKYGEPADVLS